ncbi:MAG: CHAT domain-containing protein [Cyanobacteria bacterium P01_F01_bin.150]
MADHPLLTHHSHALAAEPFVASFPDDVLIHEDRKDAPKDIALSSSTALHSDQLGYDAYDRGEFQTAIDAWQQTVHRYEQEGNTLAQAQTLSNLSLAWQQLGQWNKAQEAIATSLNLVTHEMSASSSVVRDQLGYGFNIQGRLHFALGHTHHAFDAWEQSADWCEKANNDTGRIQSQINQTQAMQELGLHRQALEQLNTLQSTLQQDAPNSEFMAMIRHQQGDILSLLGHFYEAEQALQDALAIAQTQNSGEVAAILFSLGKIANLQENYQAALDFYDRALAHLASPTSAPPTLDHLAQEPSNGTTTKNVVIDSLLVVQIQLAQLQQFTTTQDYQSAWQLWPQIETTLDQLSPSHDSLYARINLAYHWLHLTKESSPAPLLPCSPAPPLPCSPASPTSTSVTETRLHMAQRLMDTAKVAREIGDRRSEIFALGYLGAIYESTQQWSSAETLTKQALQLAQGANALDSAYRWQWQLGRILKAEGDDKGAIAAYTEAVNLLKSLRGNLVASSYEEQFRFRHGVEPLYRALVDLLLPTQTSAPIPRSNLDQAREVIESLHMAELDDFFQEPCLDDDAFPVDQVDPHAAVLYPIILSDRLEIILSLAHHPLYHYIIPISSQELTDVIQEFRNNLVIRSRFDFKAQSQQLYDWLVRPILSDLAPNQVKTLVFVLDGPLRNIPMAALSDGNHYLIEDYRVAIAPGLNVIDPKPLPRKTLNVLAAGLTKARQGFSALSYVEPELRKIQESVPSTVLLDDQFTRNALQTELAHSAFPIVHIATHGQFSSSLENTFLLTWSERLKIDELKSALNTRTTHQPTAIELLVLSACETATGDPKAPLGLAGIAVKAGARSIIATLWSVNDAATAELMKSFYQQLTDSDIAKSEALRQAQLELLHHSRYNHSLYWAPYLLVGNWL